MRDCIFCRIVDGEIDAEVVYKNDRATAFLDANPLVDGHTVVVPDEHVERLSDMDGQTAVGVFSVVQGVTDAILSQLGADGVNVGLNDGEAAGQAIPHTHVHIIPRYTDDEGGSLHSIIDTKTHEELGQVAQKLKSGISSR